MEEVEDYMIEPPEDKRKVVGRCDFCHGPIYEDDVIYSSCDFEACEDCKDDFLLEYRRRAK